MTNTVFTDWSRQHTELFGRHSVRLQHRLQETDLFTDLTLARLIDRYPETHYSLHVTSAPEDPARVWRRGLIGDCPGMEVIRGIRDGRLWLHLERVNEVDPRYARLMECIFSEIEGHVPGLRAHGRALGIMISSPRAQLHYTAGLDALAMWQVRGSSRLRLYPEKAPFLRNEDLEAMAAGETPPGPDFEPWFDDYAEAYDLTPGQMVSWPLGRPYRIVNHHCLNVIVTTRHITRDDRTEQAVVYANGLLRRHLHLAPQRQVHGPSAYAKAAVAKMHRTLTRAQAPAGQRYEFKMDPRAFDRVVELPMAAE